MDFSSEAFLQNFHRKFPSCSSNGFSLGYTSNGQTSYDLIVDKLKTAQEGPLLDIACGDGHLLTLFAKSRKQSSMLYGIDMSEGELEVAWKNPLLNVDQIIKANARKLPFSKTSMQSVTCHMAMMLMPKVDEIIKEIHRVLKPGGTFVAIIPTQSELNPVRKIYRDWLEANIQSEKLKTLKSLGDSRVNSEVELEKLFSNFNQFELEHHETVYNLTPEQMVNHFSTCYASGLLNDVEFNKLEEDLLKAYKNLGQDKLHYVMPITVLTAVK